MVTLEDLIAEQLKINETHVQRYEEQFTRTPEMRQWWIEERLRPIVDTYRQNMNKYYDITSKRGLTIVNVLKARSNFDLIQGLTEESCGCMESIKEKEEHYNTLSRLELTVRLINAGFIDRKSKL